MRVFEENEGLHHPWVGRIAWAGVTERQRFQIFLESGIGACRRYETLVRRAKESSACESFLRMLKD